MYIVFITCLPVSAMLSGTITILQCKFMSPLFDFLLINPHSTHVIPHYCLHTHSSSLSLTPPLIVVLPLPPMLQCQRHTTILPGGSRAGFFIGDAAGVGKGRQARTQHLHPLCAVCCLCPNTVLSTQSVVVELYLKQGLLSIITMLFQV